MVFRRSDLQEAFFVPGTYPFRVYGYATTDPLEEVLASGYFEGARGSLHPGELIYVSMRPRETGRGAVPDQPRMVLVMVRADERDGDRAAGAVRLVQDFGRPGDGPGRLDGPAAGSDVLAPPAPVKRGRGRPPGSRTKKPA